jgi:hypothetical protein
VVDECTAKFVKSFNKRITAIPPQGPGAKTCHV